MKHMFSEFWPAFMIAMIAILAALFVYMICSREPCDRYVTGQVHVTDDRGRDALVQHTWCTEWKPGREPKGATP